ncbi:MAG TPA: CinA family protein [Rhizomicrobium sp.]|nr:CinA family protein [Rhizomicrobium sp.]
MAAPCIDPELIAHAEHVVAALKQAGSTVVTAESCTAGLLAAVLSHVEGAGDVLHGSFVTYSKANKSAALGVDPELLRRAGSVNAEVVRQLARGALERSPADLAIAVSGVLGPKPDEDGNPVGLVYFCCCSRHGELRVERRDFGAQGDDVLRRAAILEALRLLAEP